MRCIHQSMAESNNRSGWKSWEDLLPVRFLPEKLDTFQAWIVLARVTNWINTPKNRSKLSDRFLAVRIHKKLKKYLRQKILVCCTVVRYSFGPGFNTWDGIIYFGFSRFFSFFCLLTLSENLQNCQKWEIFGENGIFRGSWIHYEVRWINLSITHILIDKMSVYHTQYQMPLYPI